MRSRSFKTDTWSVKAALSAGAALALFTAPGLAGAGVTMSVVSQPALSGADHPKWSGPTDTGTGNTSICNDTTETMKHSGTNSGNYGYFTVEGNASTEVAYFQRDRDLGQTFKYTGTTGRKLNKITIKTGPGTRVVRPAMYGQPVGLQIFRVTGTPSLNNNGTGTNGKHGWPHWPVTSIGADRDDYYTGETYTSLATATGATFPPASAFGCGSSSPDPNDACLKGKYLQFDLTGTDEVTLTNNETYAFMLMVVDQGTDRGFTVANAFYGSYADGHGIRREGTGTIPPTAADWTKAHTDPANAAALASASFGSWASRTALSPTSNGYPDVDTWRDLEFYAETSSGCAYSAVPSVPSGLTATAGNAQVSLSWSAASNATSYNILRSTTSGSGYASIATGQTGTSYTNTGLTNGTTYYYVVAASNCFGTSANSSQASATPAGGSTTKTDTPINANWARGDQATTSQTSWLNVRSDTSKRKSWLNFDLSNDGIGWTTATSVKLKMTVAEQPSSCTTARTVYVYAVAVPSPWPSPFNWNNGPSNNTASAWQFNSATQVGTAAITCPEAVGSVITVTLDLNHFKNDADKKFTLGMSFGADNTGSSFKFYETGASAPKIEVVY